MFHVTELSQFRKCRTAWSYKYQEQLQHKTAVNYNSLLGTNVHYALAGYYARDFNPIVQFKRKCEESPSSPEVDEMNILGTIMLEGYLECYKDEKLEVVSVEVPYTAMMGNYDLIGTLDLVVKIDGLIYGVDHKTCKTFTNPEDVSNDDQMSAYIYLLSKYFGYENVGGMIYNQLLKKIPASPQLLKNGSLSKDKSIVTTRQKYYDAIIENGLNPDDYEDILYKIECTYKFYDRMVTTRTEHELKTWEQNTIAQMSDMSTPLVYPNVSKDHIGGCARCSFYTLCRATRVSSDLDYVNEIRDTEFEVCTDEFHGTDMEEMSE